MGTKTVGERVFQRLREKILQGEYKPDRKFNIDLIARDLGVSNTPVREAMARLERLGLVETIPYQGPRIKNLDKSQVVEICDIRTSLEVLAVRLIVERNDPEILDGLAEALKMHEVAYNDDNPQAAMKADRAFHAALVQASGNSVLIEMLPGLSDRTALMIALNTTLSKGLLESSASRALQSHKRIFEALRIGDVGAATQAMRHHLSRVKAHLTGNMPEPQEV